MSTTGFRPTNTIAATGSRPTRRAERHTRNTMPKLVSISRPFKSQNEIATPSGTTMKVISVNSGPYGLSS